MDCTYSRERFTMSKTNIHHVIILDRSGSMFSIAQETITGFNEVIEQIREDADENSDTQNHFVSLVVFNGNVDKVNWLEPVEKVAKLNQTSYKPSGSTAMVDAICDTIQELKMTLDSGSAIGDLSDGRTKVFMTVITDGHENASKEYSQDDLRGKIESLKQDDDDSPWTMNLIGANIDVIKTGSSMGFRAGMSSAFKADSFGTTRAFDTLKNTRSAYTYGVSNNWTKQQTDAVVAQASSIDYRLSAEEMDRIAAQAASDSESDSNG